MLCRLLRLRRRVLLSSVILKWRARKKEQGSLKTIKNSPGQDGYGDIIRRIVNGRANMIVNLKSGF